MKKIITVVCFCVLISGIFSPVFAINIGTYKTETEYGLLDGFKFNWKRKDKSTPFIEPRESSTKKELEKDYKNYSESEYERTKFMYEGRSII